MIKNIIFDVGMVLVNWDPHAAFQELGFDEKTEEAVGKATVYSDAWNESDCSVLDAEEQLAVFVQNAPEYEKEIRLFWENVARAIYQYDYSRTWIRELKQKGYQCISFPITENGLMNIQRKLFHFFRMWTDRYFPLKFIRSSRNRRSIGHC